ncbi:hypothetical protein [Flavobacterium pallidum]|uniref:Uncharacterized protein n=1 Tax=Flavobacterium pallidum TaxID=2172098 RepID=A0A2S1SKC7_9FLAO|nr:hypothetical protein [Flavobacterium pallidum]AWI26829.1 hypothetical protein HYN49_13490 [Flavobacterium pallidum]
MKRLLFIFFILTLFSSCNNNKSKKKSSQEELEEKHHMEIHKELDKVDTEYKKFEDLLKWLYKQSEVEPKLVHLKIDSLIMAAKKERDPIKSQISKNVISQLFYFKAEIDYRQGKYQESIENIYKSNFQFKHIHSDDATALAANYIKLKKNEMAKSFIDSIGKGFYIYDYALGNYYESVGNKNAALKIYYEIKTNKRRHQHYFYYQPVLNRIIDIEKHNHLINEIHFPTGYPDFDITIDNDNELRTKILNYMDTFPEVKGYSVFIYQGPLIDETDYYWIRVGKGDNFEDDDFAKYNFAVYSKPFEVKFFEPITKKMYSLSEWRKKKNGI